LQGKKVLVLGLGRKGGGVGVARWAVANGAEVVVTDLGREDELRSSIEELDALPVRFALGRHDAADVEWADLVIRNPAIPSDSWVLERARELGTPVTMEIALFLQSTRAPVVGITGTKGKTTTSYATHHLVTGSFARAEIVGNMGISALAQAGLRADGIAVAEVSSFQAEGLAEARIAPVVFVVTNLLEDHLDRYPSLEAYHEAKVAVFDHQGPGDWAILPSRRYDRERLDGRVRGRLAYFQSAGEPLPEGADGVWVSKGVLRGRWAGEEIELVPVTELPIVADHYASNAAAAACAALAAGVAPGTVRDRLRSLRPRPDRQELVATVDGVDYVNDTTATAPAATAASIRTYEGRDVILIAGGADKGGLDPAPLATAVVEAVRTVVLLEGTATDGIAAALRAEGYESVVGPLGSMDAAVAEARAVAEPDAVVLLAPGAASVGLFEDEFHRGAEFRRAVQAVRD
jgi:UDP-N-acetylmuramoylalanine--D-glutamate ligase